MDFSVIPFERANNDTESLTPISPSPIFSAAMLPVSSYEESNFNIFEAMGNLMYATWMSYSSLMSLSVLSYGMHKILHTQEFEETVIKAEEVIKDIDKFISENIDFLSKPDYEKLIKIRDELIKLINNRDIDLKKFTKILNKSKKEIAEITEHVHELKLLGEVQF
jgi:predicted component of type VI protein secretion system